MDLRKSILKLHLISVNLHLNSPSYWTYWTVTIQSYSFGIMWLTSFQKLFNYSSRTKYASGQLFSTVLGYEPNSDIRSRGFTSPLILIWKISAFTHTHAPFHLTSLYVYIKTHSLMGKKKSINFKGCLRIAKQLGLALLLILANAGTVRTNFYSVTLSSQIAINTSKSYGKFSLCRKLWEKNIKAKALEIYIYITVHCGWSCREISWVGTQCTREDHKSLNPWPNAATY